MILTVTNIVVWILSSINMQNSIQTPDSGYKVRNVPKIELSEKSVIWNIIEDYMRSDSLSDNGNYYFLIYSKYKNGTLVKCASNVDVNLKNIMGYIGYTTINEKTVFIDGDGSYKFKFSNPPQNIQIKKATDWQSGTDPAYTYYYIIDDIYAKFSQQDGWLWSDGKPDE